MVMFNAVNILSGEGGDGDTGARIQECWEFAHPVKTVVLNERGGRTEEFPDALGAELPSRRTSRNEQSQFSVRQPELPHPSRGGSPWPRGLFRSSSIRERRAEHSPTEKRSHLERYDQLVPNILPVQGESSIPPFLPQTDRNPRRRIRCIFRGIRNCKYRCGGSPTSNGCGMSGTLRRFCR